MNKEYISIFKPQRVRKLLKKGFNIYDIKADKNKLDRTIFIFKNREELHTQLQSSINLGHQKK